MGVTEISTRDNNGNEFWFTCQGGQWGTARIQVEDRPAPIGSITIDIDGERFSFQVSDGGKLRTSCRVCGDEYIRLWEATAAGERMTIVPAHGSQVVFSLNGSRAALGHEVCYPEVYSSN